MDDKISDTNYKMLSCKIKKKKNEKRRNKEKQENYTKIYDC